MLQIYPEIFDKKRRRIFKKLSFFNNIGYLGGGTALALQLKHRQSFDFDIFLPKPITPSLFKSCQEVFGSNLEILINNNDQLTFITPEKITLTFLYYWFAPLEKFVASPSFIRLASITDIAADKAYTIGRRGVWRDYVDIFYLIKNNLLSLPSIIKAAQKKFASAFSKTLFLEQLVYFEDIRDFTIEWIKKNIDSTQIKDFLQKEVKKLF